MAFCVNRVVFFLVVAASCGGLGIPRNYKDVVVLNSGCLYVYEIIRIPKRSFAASVITVVS